MPTSSKKHVWHPKLAMPQQNLAIPNPNAHPIPINAQVQACINAVQQASGAQQPPRLAQVTKSAMPHSDNVSIPRFVPMAPITAMAANFRNAPADNGQPKKNVMHPSKHAMHRPKNAISNPFALPVKSAATD